MGNAWDPFDFGNTDSEFTDFETLPSRRSFPHRRTAGLWFRTSTREISPLSSPTTSFVGSGSVARQGTSLPCSCAFPATNAPSNYHRTRYLTLPQQTV